MKIFRINHNYFKKLENPKSINFITIIFNFINLIIIIDKPYPIVKKIISIITKVIGFFNYSIFLLIIQKNYLSEELFYLITYQVIHQ